MIYYEDKSVKLYNGDCREMLRQLPDRSVHCVVTSPPYLGLRDYGIAGQIGLEISIKEFISTLISVFSEVWRVLRDDGTCWVNIGDAYAAVFTPASLRIGLEPDATFLFSRACVPGAERRRSKDSVSVWIVVEDLQELQKER